MKTIDISKLQADPITKALIDAKGNATPISGYIHSICEEFIRISTSRGSQHHIDCPKADVLAALESDEQSGKIFLLVANNAQIRVINHCKAHELNERKQLLAEMLYLAACERNNDTGVAEARPLGSIHPALAALAAEIRLIKGMVGTGPGARELRCEEAFHDSIINGENVADANFNRELCLAGIDV